MKIPGIIGGFGPEATARFQLEIVEIFRARNISTRPPILIWQTPIPLKIEEEFIKKPRGAKDFLPFLIQGAKILEKGGANFLVIPCNSLHAILKDLRQSVQLPILSIIDETSTALKNNGLRKVGIIGTKALIESGLLQNALISKNIKTIIPSIQNQELINKSIFQILTNKNLNEVKKSLLTVTQELVDLNTRDILVACTDLKPFCPNLKEVTFLDSLSILATATANKILSERR